MDLGLIVNLAVVAAALALLARRQTRGATLSSGVLIGLLAGALLGAALQAAYGHGDETVAGTVQWLNLVGGGYVRLLQMIVVPLVLVSILSAVTRLSDARSLGRISAGVLGTLLVTTAASAAIGIGVARWFGLSAEGLVQGARELERGTKIQESATQLADLSVPDLLLSFLPTNPFADLAGSRPTSLIAVVIFAALLGMAALGLRRDRPEAGARVIAAIDDVQALVLRLVRMVIRLTPYGVLALMTKVVATSNPQDVLGLIRFVAASYLGLALILLMHGVLLALAGSNPVEHFRRVWPVLTFAFTSRSSAATIPLTVETQTDRLGVPPAVANFAASFGATIGQNGCAGLYPAMLAVMIAPTAGINPADPGFLLTLVLVVTLSSFGIAGVGGGATFAAILVLSTLNLPIALAGLLISIEPLIDMGRTAVNVHGAITAGTVTSRLLGEGAAEPAAAPSAVVSVPLTPSRAA